MSRGSMRGSSDLCADCSAPDPKWASINRGVLLCDECCCVHRSLGRHVSQVRSLKKGLWAPTQLAMVHQLASSGANNIWEYSLLDPTISKNVRRKPMPRDPLHPAKADFIRAKYQFLAFTKKFRDDELGTVTDLSKQLYSSVRTNNLDTSLRLLSHGADPNLQLVENGTCALHMAAQCGQALQVELLVAYGADPATPDTKGWTPVDYARSSGHQDLAHRLMECQYELTDRLTQYLCGRKPDHLAGQHFLIPEMADGSVDLSELAKVAKKKLQALQNNQFEDLAMDVYDEVDRRENDTAQSSTANLSERQSVPFLPVNPEFSSPRNQGRQKLARFSAREFATLLIDILTDAKKRQQGGSVLVKAEGDAPDSGSGRVVKTNRFSDDEPAYDSVASDEDYASVGVLGAGGAADRTSLHECTIDEKSAAEEDALDEADHAVGSSADTSDDAGTSFNCKSASPPQMSGSIPHQHPSSPNGYPEAAGGAHAYNQYADLQRALSESEARIQQLQKYNTDLHQELAVTKTKAQLLMEENAELKKVALHASRAQSMAAGSQASVALPPTTAATAAGVVTSTSGSILLRHQLTTTTRKVSTTAASPLGSARPQSMFVDRNKFAYTNFDGGDMTTASSLSASCSHLGPDVATGSGASGLRGGSKVLDDIESDGSSSVYDNEQGTSSTGDSSTTVCESSAVSAELLPTEAEVTGCTANLTRKIQDLLVAARDNKHDSYVICAEKIHEAVIAMVSLFPKVITNDDVKAALSLLVARAQRLQNEASRVSSMLLHADDAAAGRPSAGSSEQLLISCAYDLAQAAKALVTLLNVK